MFTKKNIVTVLVIVCAYGALGFIDHGNNTNEVSDTEKNAPKNNERGENLARCTGLFSSKCIKINILSFLDDLSSRDELALFGGMSIVKENSTETTLSTKEMAAELSKKFPGKPDEKLNEFLMYRLKNYLDGHSLRYKLLDTTAAANAIEMTRGAVSGRKGGKGGGGGGALAALLLGFGALGAAALGALGLLAGKALMAALGSLLLSALVGLKGHGEHKSTHYEIITKPEISHHHSQSHEEHHEHDHGHHGGYRRAYDVDYNYSPYYTSSKS